MTVAAATPTGAAVQAHDALRQAWILILEAQELLVHAPAFEQELLVHAPAFEQAFEVSMPLAQIANALLDVVVRGEQVLARTEQV